MKKPAFQTIALGTTLGMLLLVPTARAAERYVDASRPNDAGPGTDWGNAYKSIQAAVTELTGQIGSHVIYVADGEYTPFTTQNWPIRIQSMNGPSKTTINAEGFNTRCATLGGSIGQHNTVLAGFTLTNGNSVTYGGGALYGTLTNCVITGNSVSNSGGGTSYSILVDCTVSGNTAPMNGGGVFNGTLVRCAVSGNTAQYGGGAHSAELTDCTVSGNTATVYGGGAYNTILVNCEVSGNTAGTYGGGAHGGALTDCVIIGNAAVSGGGGTYYSALENCTVSGNSAQYGGGTYDGSLLNCTVAGNTANAIGGGAYFGTLIGCTISGNMAHTSGGGAYNTILVNCVVSGNTANNIGGGAFYGTLINCVLSGNSAYYGGGTDTATLTNCLLTANSATFGGGAYGSTLANCTVAGNTAPYSAGVYNTVVKNSIVWDNFRPDGTLDNYYMGSFEYSCSTDLFGSNNITSDPLFVNAEKGNYRLRLGSPCRDAGNNSFVGIATDLDGNTRIINWADMGAYEIQVPTLLYVRPDGDDNDNGQSWDTAKETLQGAIIEAQSGYGGIVVTNGTYAPFTSPNLDVRIESVNGAEWTIIDGLLASPRTRCATLGSAAGENNTVLSGFTLKNGQVSGIGNHGAGALYGTLENCRVTGNEVAGFTLRGNGGGAYGSVLNDCEISGNVAVVGGGAFDCVLTGCLVTGNKAVVELRNTGNGGGAYGGSLLNCQVMGNEANYDGGGTYDSTVKNCMVFGNSAGNAGGGAYGGTLVNCTVAGNSAPESAGVHAVSAWNSIVWLNFNLDVNIDLTLDNHGGDSVFNHSCTVPLPQGGTGNIAQEPLFENMNENARLRPGSPCIGAGDNSVVGWELDLDGNPRILGPGRVDMGAYQTQPVAGKVIYVDAANGSDANHGLTWTLAKKTLTNAVDVAQPGWRVVVADGEYAPFNSNNKKIRIESVNGPEKTIIVGGRDLRCATLGNVSGDTDTVLSGFTLTNGFLRLGNGGGSLYGTLENCVLTMNSTQSGSGGGAYGGVLVNCRLEKNSTSGTSAYGGGAHSALLVNCLLVGNTISVIGNARGGGANNCTLINCTVVGNSVSGGLFSGAAEGGGVYGSVVKNSIVWGNFANMVLNNYAGTCSFDFSCTTPNPGTGNGNIFTDPQFATPGAGDYRLGSKSPCIDAGHLMHVFMGVTDLAGAPRIMGLRVDMGAYEFNPTPAGGAMTAQITAIEVGAPSGNLRPVVLDFDYFGVPSLDGIPVAARTWHNLGGAFTDKNGLLVDSRNGKARLTVQVDATETKAFFRLAW